MPKSDAGIRIIPIPDKLMAILQPYMMECGNILFPMQTKEEFMTKSSFRKFWDGIIKKSGLPDDVTPHILRHPYVKLKLKILSAYFSRTFGAKVLDFPHDFKPIIGIYAHLFDKHIDKCLC